MNSFTTMFSFVGIVVLAIVVIFLVLWVARLSSKIKRLTDAFMFDPAQSGRQASSRGSYQQASRSAGGQHGYAGGANRGQSQARAAAQGGATGQRVGARRQQAGHVEQGNAVYGQQAQAVRQQPAQMGMHQQVQQTAQQAMQMEPQHQYEEMPSGMRTPTSADMYGAYQDEEDEFFETYRDRDGGQQSLRGRGKPNIPFGADKNVIERRRETYAGSAADLDYDPDSIDFTRVQGYRNLYR